jgi:hypothetical protein
MDRLLWVLGLVAICALVAYGMLAGWRHRGGRQSGLAPLPTAPADLGDDLVAPVTGLYISTTTAGEWQDRIVAQGLGRRAAGAIRLSAAGVCIERDGESDIFIPVASIDAVGTTPGVAGKVMGMAHGVLLVRWMLGEVKLESGFRANSDRAQADFIDAARELIAAPEAGGSDTNRPPAGRPDIATNDSPSANGAP